jgi:hypothetical protein
MKRLLEEEKSLSDPVKSRVSKVSLLEPNLEKIHEEEMDMSQSNKIDYNKINTNNSGAEKIDKKKKTIAFG